MIQLIHDGDDYYDQVILDITHAETSICIESYIFSYDSVGQNILNHLALAQRRGVKVELLIDGFGSFFWLQKIEKFCNENFIRLKVYRKFPIGILTFSQSIFRFAFRTQKLFSRLNQRNHRKLILIDQKIAYLGSLNITAEHSRRAFGRQAWRDTGVRYTGPIKELINAFYFTWKRHRLRRKNPFSRGFPYQPSNSVFRLNTTRKWRRWMRKDYLRRLNEAQNEILITSAYFLPTSQFIKALIKAKQRGVRVAIIIPHLSDVFLVKLASQQLLHQLLKVGVEVFEYQKSVLHAKYCIIDHTGFVGSFNFNHRSLIHDLEVEIRLDQNQIVTELKEQWEIDCTQSLPLNDQNYTRKNWIYRLGSWIAFRLKYWL